MTIAQEIVELSGAIYIGIQDGGRLGDLVLFNDPISHGTLAIRENELTTTAIILAMDKSRKAFADAKRKALTEANR